MGQWQDTMVIYAFALFGTGGGLRLQSTLTGDTRYQEQDRGLQREQDMRHR
jgi:hypothetical protein